jgi:uncharacterized paraquat-inducible protein A
MRYLVLALVVLVPAFQAYRKARAEGTWSWKLFAVVLAGIALICAVSIPLIIMSGDALRAGQILLGVLGMVCAGIVMIAGVIALAVLTKPRKRR